MGLYCSAIHVRHSSQGDVADGLADLVRERALVSDSLHGWVSVYDATAEQNFHEGKRLSTQLSKGLGAVVLLLDLYDDAVTRYALFNAGDEIDEFDSCPDYFQPAKRSARHRGDAQVLKRYGKAGNDLDVYRSLLEPSDPASLTEPDRMRGLARTFGIPTTRAVLAYSSISPAKAKRLTTVSAGANDAAGSALTTAIRQGDTSAVRAFLKRGVSADAVDAQGITPIQRAVEGGSVAILRLLLSPASGKAPLTAALCWAGVRQDISSARALLRAGADPNGRDDHGASPLFRAVYHPKADPAMARLLVKAGAQPSDTLMVEHIGVAPRATTPLHAAATLAPVEVVRVLAAAAMTRDVKDALGKTPLLIAEERGRSEVARALRKGSSAAGVPRKPK